MSHAKPTYAQLERMYFDQCAAAEELGVIARQHGDETLRARIAELEQQLATVNARLAAANAQVGSRSFCGDGRPDQVKKMWGDMNAAALAQLNSDWGDASPEKKNA